MRRRSIVLVTMLLAAPVAAQLTGEHLAPAADPAFRLGYAAAANGLAMQEYVPAGETVEQWTRMITVQRYGYRPGLTPARFAEAWLAGLSRFCGAAAQPVTTVTLAGHNGVDARYDCPKNPQTGKPETVTARIVLGDTALHVVQAATRRSPNPADLGWMTKVMAGTLLCGNQVATPRCTATAQPALGSIL